MRLNHVIIKCTLKWNIFLNIKCCILYVWCRCTRFSILNVQYRGILNYRFFTDTSFITIVVNVVVLILIYIVHKPLYSVHLVLHRCNPVPVNIVHCRGETITVFNWSQIMQSIWKQLYLPTFMTYLVNIAEFWYNVLTPFVIFLKLSLLIRLWKLFLYYLY